MHSFEYEAAPTLSAAVQLLSQYRSAARLLAGGTDLIDQMRLGRHTPDFVIDLKRIPELNVLEINSEGVRLGAAVPCYRIASHGEIVARYSALADSCRIIGGVQIQSRASVGGNLCNSGPAADSIPALIALGAKCVIAGSSGAREVPVESFCLAPGKNVLAADELLVELKIPHPASASGSHYRRLIPRNEMDIAVVGVGASITLDAAGERIIAARIGLGAVAPTPLWAEDAGSLLVGRAPNDESWELAAAAAQRIISPISDMRGTKEYRTHVTGVLVRRVLGAAAARARGQTIDYCPGH